MGSRTPKGRADREASAEDLRRTLELAENPPPRTSIDELRKLIARWAKEWSQTERTPASTLADILREPQRFVEFLPLYRALERPVLILDKANREVMEYKPRGVRVLNKLSLAGLDFCDVDDEADRWLREQRSGRVLKNDGSIV
jgi:hypothetical protein